MALSTMNTQSPALEDLLAVQSAPLERVFVPPTTPPKKSVGKRLTRDQRRDILLLRDLGSEEYPYGKIASVLSQRYGTKITVRAVQYTCNAQKGTPKKHRLGTLLPPRSYSN